MISKWFHLKTKAISLRKEGLSISYIETKLGITRSTLSGWFKDIILTEIQKKNLDRKRKEALVKARKGAILWHNTQKENRLKIAELESNDILSRIENKPEIIELALSFLYLGEGFKTSSLGMGNSDPMILKFFLFVIFNIYKLDVNRIGFYLHLRADQNQKLMKSYWSKELNVPIDRFRKVSVDKRTYNTKTYPHYKGVCVIQCGNVAIQRRLIYISKKFCSRIIQKHT